MVTKRLSHEIGHSRKFLAVVDDSPECSIAVWFASKRAAKTNGKLALLYVCEPADFQHWIGVGEVMRAEALEEAQVKLDEMAKFAAEKSDIEPETVIREGKIAEEILQLIEDDPDIAILVLGAGDSSDGPGPLVSMIAGKSNSFPIPVLVVPGTMSQEEIEAVS